KGLAARLLGGWEAGVVFTAYSGGPLGVTSSVNGTFSQGGGQRPNWDGRNPALVNPTPYAWLDPRVFSTPPSYQFGTAPRPFSGVRSDYTRGADVSLHKDPQLHERLVLQFRAEAFNISNTPVFAPPNVSFGSPAFGVVSAQADLPRILQFALKLIY